MTTQTATTTETSVFVYRGIRIERRANSTTWGFRVNGFFMGRNSLDEAKQAIDSKLKGKGK